jgi:hypothetical protein
MLDVTDRVQRAVRDAQVIEGYAIVYVPHTTACVAKLPVSPKRSPAKGFAVLADGTPLSEHTQNARRKTKAITPRPRSTAARTGRDSWRDGVDG